MKFSRDTVGPDKNGTIGHTLWLGGMMIGAYTGPIDLENEVEKKASLIVNSVNCHNRLVDALDKLLALYRKETNLHYGLDNPITKECREILVEARRV